MFGSGTGLVNDDEEEEEEEKPGGKYRTQFYQPYGLGNDNQH